MTNENEKMNSPQADFESMKCVWMSSGLVNYKLCDFNFNCDDCPFDKSMHNVHHLGLDETKSIYELIEGKIHSLKSTDCYSTHLQLNNNVILKKLYENSYYLGLNRLAYTLLDNISDYEILSEKDIVTKDEPLIKIQGDWGKLTIPSPAPFLSIEKIKKNTADVCSNTWLALIEAPENISDFVITRKEYDEKINNLERVLADCLVETPVVVITLNDGGKPIRFLYELVGKKKYLEILKIFF
jgi:hypothetical protein